jgi:SAM-dependent methyltransferase
MSGFWDRHVVPRLIGCACRQPAIMKDRAKIVPRASGDVLELGCGGAANLSFYDWYKVRSLSGIDPSAELLERAHAELAHSGRKANFAIGVAEALPFASGSFDTVLRPGGKLLFVEHGQAPDTAAAKWQTRIEPVWKHIAGGCHLTRPVTQAISASGFATEGLQGHYMKRTPRWLGWVEWGEARVIS